eukprot:4173679-Prorocentrum_lima.AAC.1
MTSSLVGSEMCIRDRIKSNFKGGASRPVGKANASSYVRKVGAGSSKAVSYTHLTLPTICSV